MYGDLDSLREFQNGGLADGVPKIAAKCLHVDTCHCSTCYGYLCQLRKQVPCQCAMCREARAKGHAMKCLCEDGDHPVFVLRCGLGPEKDVFKNIRWCEPSVGCGMFEQPIGDYVEEDLYDFIEVEASRTIKRFLLRRALRDLVVVANAVIPTVLVSASVLTTSASGALTVQLDVVNWRQGDDNTRLPRVCVTTKEARQLYDCYTIEGSDKLFSEILPPGQNATIEVSATLHMTQFSFDTAPLHERYQNPYMQIVLLSL